MKIIVTGGAGFIASHVVDAYIKAGHKVTVIDNLATGFVANVNKKAKFFKADIRDQEKIEAIFKKVKPDIVNHHAAIAEVVKSLVNPIPTYDVNLLGTANVLVAFGKYGSKKGKFIFSSTGGAIYGEPKIIPADESTEPTPLSPYGLSKKLGEELIHFYSKQHGFSYLIFRYPNVYGPRQNPKGEAGVVSIFGGLMLRGKRPMIFGNGKKMRDYVQVRDIVAANLAALKKGVNDTINIGTGKGTQDIEIFRGVAKAANFNGKPIFKPHRKGEVYQIALKADRAKNILGWEPTVGLQEGINETVDSLK